jgi:hypothetical protein
VHCIQKWLGGKILVESCFCLPLYFYGAIATLLSHRLQGMLSQLGYGRRVYSQGLTLAKSVEYEDELDDSLLDGVAIAGKRFDWILGQLRVS